MKKIILIISILSLLGCSNKKQKVEVSEKDLIQAETAFSELEETSTKDNCQLWGCKLYGPTILVNSENRTFIANEQNAKNEFTKKDDVFIGKLPEQINISNTAINWDGKRWTMVMLPLPDSKYDRVNLLIHESFHRIQPNIGYDSLSEIQNNHLDTKDGRIFLELELLALKHALNSDKPEEHIKNAMVFRCYRHQQFLQSSAAENSLEINEGIAEYTGSILCGLNDEEIKKHYSQNIDYFFSKPTFVRSFPYVTIPVYGYFMSIKDKTWNLKVNKKTNLTDFICSTFGITQKKIDLKDIQKLGEQYNFESISKFEENREVKQLALIEKYKKQFLANEFIVIQLQSFSFSFNPSNVMPLDTFGTVYPNLRITDNWGILEVDSCGALLTNWKKVTISKPIQVAESQITGNGWKLMLNKGWKLDKKENHYELIKN